MLHSDPLADLMPFCEQGSPGDPAATHSLSVFRASVLTRARRLQERTLSISPLAARRERTLTSSSTLTNVTFSSSKGFAPQGLVAVQVGAPRVMLGKPPLPFRDAGPFNRRKARLSATDLNKQRILRSGYVRVDGLRLAEIETVDTAAPPGRKVPWHEIALQSLGVADSPDAVRYA